MFYFEIDFDQRFSKSNQVTQILIQLFHFRWEEEKKDDGVKWRFLEHKGPLFAPLYERLPRKVKFYYDGKRSSSASRIDESINYSYLTFILSIHR